MTARLEAGDVLIMMNANLGQQSLPQGECARHLFFARMYALTTFEELQQ